MAIPILNTYHYMGKIKPWGVFFWVVFFLPLHGIGQIYTSPITQYFPGSIPTKFEDVSRSLEIGPENITLTTITNNGKLFESYRILEIKDGPQDVRFLCTSRNRESLVTVIIPSQKKIEVIDIYRRSEVTGKVEQLRLWVD